MTVRSKVLRLSKPKSLIGATVFMLALVYTYWIAGDILELSGDEGIYLEGGRRIAMGQLPYRDFFLLTGPLTFWIEGVMAHLSGMNLVGMRLPMILDTAFLTWAVYWFTSRYTSSGYAAGSAFAFLAYESRIRLLNANHRWDSAALATAAIMLALAARDSKRFWIASGLLAAAAAWATPSILIVGVPLLWWIGSRGIRGAFAFLGGAALISGAAAFYLHSNHALLPMIESMRWTSANYTAPNRVSYGNVWAGAVPDLAAWQYLTFTLYAMIPAILPPAALAGWAVYWRMRAKPVETAEIVPLLATAAALTVAAWPRWSSDTLLHTMALSWFLCALLLYRLTTPIQRFWWCGAVLLLSSVSVAGKITAPFNYLSRETRVGTLRDVDSEGEMLDSLERWVQPGDSLFSFPYLPSAYYYLDAPNPSRYTFLQPGMMNQEDERRAVEELQAKPPRWVIYEKFPVEAVLKIWPGSDPARIPMAAMNTYLSEHYHVVGTAAGPRGHVIVMERTAVRY